MGKRLFVVAVISLFAVSVGAGSAGGAGSEVVLPDRAGDRSPVAGVSPIPPRMSEGLARLGSLLGALIGYRRSVRALLRFLMLRLRGIGLCLTSMGSCFPLVLS